MILIVALIVFVLFGSNFVKIGRLIVQKRSLENQIAREQQNSEELDNEIKQIGTKSYIEYIARKNLGLVYPDEQIVVTVKSE